MNNRSEREMGESKDKQRTRVSKRLARISSPLLAIIALFLAVGMVNAQVPVALGPVPKSQFLDNNGNPLSGGLVYTYNAGTNTPLATYTDSTGLFVNSNPVVLDSGGRANIWFSGVAYKVVLKTSGGVTIWTVDNFLIQPFLASNNSWTGNETHSGTETFNGLLVALGGGTLSGTFSGNSTFSGTTNFANAVFGGTETFTNGLKTDSIAGITPGTPLVITSASNAASSSDLNLSTGVTSDFGAPSGNINVTTPDTLGASGGFNVTTGIGNSSGPINLIVRPAVVNPGAVTITAGSATQSANQGGAVTISAGNGDGAKGGDVTINSGTGSAVSFITLNPGSGGETMLHGEFHDASGFKYIRFGPFAGSCPTAAGAGDTSRVTISTGPPPLLTIPTRCFVPWNRQPTCQRLSLLRSWRLGRDSQSPLRL